MEAFDESLKAFDQEGWEFLCRSMQVLVINHRNDLACKLLMQFVARRINDAVSLDDHVAMLLPERVANALEKHGYRTFRAIKRARDSDILRIGNFGEKTLNHLREVVARIERGELVDMPDEPLEKLYDREK
jgi:hypothetical protein